MITAVLVDDERPALRELEFLLRQYGNITIIGMYTNPLTALPKIKSLNPHVVFLDINMPKLQGIDAASMILDHSPETEIVFVTAFDQYAVEAFELHALDYILKPLDRERLARTVERLLKKNPLPPRPKEPQKLQIKCFGRFRMGWEGLEPVKWRAEKTRELFLFLLQNQQRHISRDELLESLWPEDDPEKAVRQLYNGIYYIRKALQGYGIDRALLSIDHTYSIKLGPAHWDVQRFSHIHAHLFQAGLAELEEMAALYSGEYLEGEFYPWAELERESLALSYEQCLLTLAKKYMDEQKYDRAESLLLKGYQKNPYLETVSQYLVKLYLDTGNKASALRHYTAYARLLQEEMGITPGEMLRNLVEGS